MFCKKCGTQLNPEARFCKKCGVAITKLPAPSPPLLPPLPDSPVTSTEKAFTTSVEPVQESLPPVSLPQVSAIAKSEPQTVAVTATSKGGQVRDLSIVPISQAETDYAKTSSPAKSGQSRTLVIASISLIVLLISSVLTWWLWPRSKTIETSTSKTVKQGVTAPIPPQGMVYVSGGDLMMGNDGGGESERPTHKVTVKPFFIDRTEVTCEEYDKFLAATGHQAPSNWVNGRYAEGLARRPVTGVDWDDATAYAAWATKRLPTEQEWEFAARGTEGRHYPWGNEWKQGFANADSSSTGGMSDVGSFSSGASVFGVVDMAGNAWEWTASDWVPYPGGSISPSDLPGPLKVIRGGCFESKQNNATTTFRVGWPARGWHEYGNTGFRCAKDLADK